MLSVCAVSSLLGGTHFAARLISASPFSIWANERFLMRLLKAAFSAGAAKMKTFVACLPVYPTLLPTALPSRLPTTFVQKFFFAKLFWVNRASREKTFFSFATGSKSGPMKYSPSSRCGRGNLRHFLPLKDSARKKKKEEILVQKIECVSRRIRLTSKEEEKGGTFANFSH